MVFDWVGEWIAQAPCVSAASYLFITGTKFGLTSVLVSCLIWHKKDASEEDTVVPFFLSPTLIFLEWVAICLPPVLLIQTKHPDC